MTNDFDEMAIRTKLIQMRTMHGAETQIGHRCSNLLEKLENRSKATDKDQIRRLEKSIGQSVAELAALTLPKGERQ